MLTEQSAAFARRAGDSWALSMALNNLGYIGLTAGEAERATALFEEAISIARARHDTRSEAFFRENLAFAKLESQGPDAAVADLLGSLQLSHRLAFIEVVATNLVGLAAVAAAWGSDETAARLLGGADSLAARTGGGLDPVETRVRARTLDGLSERLGAASLQRLSDEGRQFEPGRLFELGSSLGSTRGPSRPEARTQRAGGASRRRPA
jgi:hypothetical protein